MIYGIAAECRGYLTAGGSRTAPTEAGPGVSFFGINPTCLRPFYRAIEFDPGLGIIVSVSLYRHKEQLSTS